MDSKFPLGYLLSAFGAAVVTVAAAGAPAPAKMPDIKVDHSPVAEGRAGVVASYADVVEPVEKVVVSVKSSKIVRERVSANPLLRQFFGDVPDQERESKEEGLGSGVIVSANGYILTNNHVVEGADEIRVVLPDDRELTAKVIGADPKTDVAVIKIDAANLPTVTFADSDKLRVGDVVFAVGNPLGVGETVTMGIVSARGRQVGILDDVGGYEDFIQTDAAINMGNSGGPLVDAKGRLVGINSAILSPSRGNIGIGFAIPVNLAMTIMKSLIETGAVTRGFLGVSTEALTPDIAEQFGLPKDAKGVLVTDVTAGKSADRAGIKPDDVIVAVNGKPVENKDELRLWIAQMPPGSKVAIALVRDGKPLPVAVTLDKFDERPDELLKGINVTPITEELRRQRNLDPRLTGLIVKDVDENSPYAEALPVGSVIIEINRITVTGLSAAQASLHAGRNLLRVYYRGSVHYAIVTVAP
jgi:serine protease Do/serine protease DegQ